MQVAGRSCAICGGKVHGVIDGKGCLRCGVAFHTPCLGADARCPRCSDPLDRQEAEFRLTARSRELEVLAAGRIRFVVAAALMLVPMGGMAMRATFMATGGDAGAIATWSPFAVTTALLLACWRGNIAARVVVPVLVLLFALMLLAAAVRLAAESGSVVPGLPMAVGATCLLVGASLVLTRGVQDYLDTSRR